MVTRLNVLTTLDSHVLSDLFKYVSEAGNYCSFLKYVLISSFPIAAPPAPTGFRKIVTANGSLSFGFIWDASFNAANNVNEYRLVANDSSVMCQQGCSSEGRCQCSGFTDGVNVSVNVSAVSCGDLEGSAVEIRVAPQGM